MLERKKHHFFCHFLYLCLNNCNGPLPMVTLRATSTEVTESLQDFDLVLAACEQEISFVLCTALLPISSLHSCSKDHLSAICKEKSAWCEDLRGIVAFPLSESHSCATRPAAHAPLTPHAPISIDMLRDRSFTDALPSSAPLKCNCVSTGWKEALILANIPAQVDLNGCLRHYNKPMFKSVEIQGFSEMEVGRREREKVKHRNLSVTFDEALKGVLSLKKIITELSPMRYKADNYLSAKT